MRRLLPPLALPLLALSCGTSADVTALLLDGSGSRTDALRVEYLALARRLAEGARPGDWVVGDLATAHSIESARFGINVAFPTLDVLSTSELDHAEAMDAARAALLAQADSLLQAPGSRCTDLLNAFTTAERAFGARRAREGARLRLVVASDMVQTCGVDFHSADLSDEGIERLVEAERAAGRLPDLTGVEVWVVAAAPATGLSADRLRRVEAFWLRYFDAAGASLPAHRYAPALVDFP